MPIYEFYCARCNTIYSFLSRRVNPTGQPACPACRAATLERRVSMFAAPAGRGADAEEGGETPAAGGEDAGGPNLPEDDPRMERAIEALAGEAEGMDENDPHQAANLMRKFSDMTGMAYGPAMREALDRMDAGEDPEAVESELGARIVQEEPFLAPGKAPEGGPPSKPPRRRAPPKRDQTLYEM